MQTPLCENIYELSGIFWHIVLPFINVGIIKLQLDVNTFACTQLVYLTRYICGSKYSFNFNNLGTASYYINMSNYSCNFDNMDILCHLHFLLWFLTPHCFLETRIIIAMKGNTYHSSYCVQEVNSYVLLCFL